MLKKFLMTAGLLVLCAPISYSAEKVELITGFEDEADADSWTADDGMEIAAENATEGKNSMKVTYTAEEEKEKRFILEGKKFESIFPGEWSEYKSLKVDIFNSNDKEAVLQVRIKSDDQKKWTKAFKLPEKRSTTLDIPMSDLRAKVSLETITYLGFAMGKNQYLTNMKPFTSDFILFFDNIRLIK